MKNIIKYIPFVFIITLAISVEVVEAVELSMQNIQSLVFICAAIILINFLIAILLKIKNYFLYGLTFTTVLGAFMVLVSDKFGQFYIENIIASMYFGLWLVTIIPPIFKLKPFVYEYSEEQYPISITQSKRFFKINMIMNFIWSFLFAITIALAVIKYNNHELTNTIIATLMPIGLLLAVGIPITKKMPDYLMQNISGEQIRFNTVDDLFDSMPFGLNKKKANDINTIIQFYLTGQEPKTCHLVISNQKCTYKEGEHPNPKTIIRCDSDLWLKISNNEVSGAKALINNEYEVEGDATIMLKLTEMFEPSKKEKIEKSEPIKLEYKTFAPGEIKNIVVFDGGYRDEKLSKTTLMVNNFINGAKSVGAKVEYFKLKDFKIDDCTGCYTCWTKKPGECILKDDMTMFHEKIREAKLIIFSSPLYIFNVTGIMKTFLDRLLLPLVKPYMIKNKHGDITHPDRYPETGEQGFVAFSACGFPEVENNFSGLSSMFHTLDSHCMNMFLTGEFYLTTAEMIVQPVYAERKRMVAEACYNAGKQIITEGKISKEYMHAVQNNMVSKETFQEHANAFWESLDGKKSFTAAVPKISQNVSEIK